jgi:hypothetical protein
VGHADDATVNPINWFACWAVGEHAWGDWVYVGAGRTVRWCRFCDRKQVA